MVNTNLYHYGVPWPWFVITSIPFLFIGYKVKIEKIRKTLVVHRCFINIPLIKTHFDLCADESISWVQSIPKPSTFQLFVGDKNTGLVIDR
jgi:hypothetical protein